LEATHHDHDAEHGREAHGDHEAPQVREGRGRGEDWFNDEFVGDWIKEQDERVPERRRQFVLIRSLVPKAAGQAFRYLNIGAGAGHLDEVLLEHFPHAEAVLLDGSMAMLGAARRRLDRFEDRVECVQADLATPDWTKALHGTFDVIVSTIAIHNLREANRIRALYGEICGLVGHGGVFLNLDYVRMARPAFGELAVWASKDPDAGFIRARGGGTRHPGTAEEQVGWLREAGFATAECVYREFGVAVLAAVHDHLHMPSDPHDHDHGHDHEAHGHEHDEHGHEHDEHEHGHAHSHDETQVIDTAHGKVELSIFEEGVPPRFRLHFKNRLGEPAELLDPSSVSVETLRPEGVAQVFSFAAHGSEFLEATETLPEPHEFDATLKVAGEDFELQFREHEHAEGGHSH
jgi:ubiquinone/menaquinone biosynthesis C-methylase UbiE